MADLSPPVPPPTPEEATGWTCDGCGAENRSDVDAECRRCGRGAHDAPAVPPSEAPTRCPNCDGAGSTLDEDGTTTACLCRPAPAPTAAEGRSAVEVLAEAVFHPENMSEEDADEYAAEYLTALRAACGDSGWTVIGPDGRLWHATTEMPHRSDDRWDPLYVRPIGAVR